MIADRSARRWDNPSLFRPARPGQQRKWLARLRWAAEELGYPSSR
ncbi:MAG TPA: hypothetical protein VEH31_36740 [Streptosporangiaceae bacterium]|nr:hypothetical protein [Streptosporangiaceae bacterium]HYA49734.1 hypothetical protein [Streptosporangiaceae bacterium]